MEAAHSTSQEHEAEESSNLLHRAATRRPSNEEPALPSATQAEPSYVANDANRKPQPRPESINVSGISDIVKPQRPYLFPQLTQWSPGATRHVPWTALFAIVLSLAASVACVILLEVSEHSLIPR